MLKRLPLLLLLTACAQPGQNQYDYRDVGRATSVEFCTVITSRPVGITGQNTGTGALIGASAGLGAGSYVGNGSGNAWGALGGALIGAVIGAAAEQAASDRDGIEYTVTTHHGETLTIVQNAKKEDKPLRDGQRCVIQTSGSYQRVMPADQMPEKIKRPKKIKVVG